MVCYCCVKGCNNKRNSNKKDPNSVISFHAFPSNIELKSKWLRAIGRPNWTAPNHARICSAHFTYDQIDYLGCRIRIKDNEVPVNELPPNSNFEASNVKVCRICLATDLKMYSLRDTLLGTYMDSIVGLKDNQNKAIDGLPQFVCYQCAAYLIKCYKVVEKTMITQATLLDIFAEHGQITKTLVKDRADRFKLNLMSPISCFKVTNYIDIQYDDKHTTYYLTKTEDNEVYYKNENELNHKCTESNVAVLKIDIEEQKVKGFIEECYRNELLSEDKVIVDSNDVILEESTDCNPTLDPKSDNESDIQENVTINALKSENEVKESKEVKRKVKKKNDIGLTPNEADMKQYFDIVKLSQQEQIEEWKRTASRRPLTSETVYECDTCFKTFANINTYRTHITSHESSQGKSECPICKLRFKTDLLAKAHANRAHGKKFYCKTCPKVFNNVGVAKKHHRWHAGYTYKCDKCSFTTAHESALGVHMRRQHRHMHACADCGLAFVSARGLGLHRATAHKNSTGKDSCIAYSCEQCNLNFTSEGARRVHILTSYQHRKKHDLCDLSTQDPSLQNTCKKCGLMCSSLNKLIMHSKAEHPRKVKKTSWKMPTDSYPTQCQLCGETVCSRKTHWWHVRRHHPKEIDTYQPVVTAVCDTCGKGFQNSTKLHLHQLRHGRPTVSCSECPRLFYDKYALSRHAATHTAAAPHRCRSCGRAFKRRANLDRHARVHTDATPYECSMCNKKFKYSSSVNLHVRTVHYKLPHPPRKKRARTAKDTLGNDTYPESVV